MNKRNRFFLASFILFISCIFTFILNIQIWMIFLPISIIIGVVGLISKNEISVEVKLSEDVVKSLDNIAEELDITREELVNNILTEEINKFEKRISKDEFFDPNNFDKVIEEVKANNIAYYICEDDDLKDPVCVIMSVEQYNNMKSLISLQ